MHVVPKHREESTWYPVMIIVQFASLEKFVEVFNSEAQSRPCRPAEVWVAYLFSLLGASKTR